MQETTLKQAFIGVRNDESKIWNLLLQCGAESLSDLASRKAPVCKAPFNLTPDKREPMSKEEYQALTSLFWNFYTKIPNDFILSSGLPENLFDYFFERAVASGKRVPSQFLYHFAKGIRKTPVSTKLVSILCGRTGYWLSQSDSTGRLGGFTTTVFPPEIFESTPDVCLILKTWNDYSNKERVLVFEQTHRSRPKLAFEIMRLGQSRFTEDSERDCLELISDSLSEEDLEFLERQDQNTSYLRWCRRSDPIVLDLLARIPTSNYAQEAFETAKKLLTNPDAFADLKPNETESFLTLSSVPLARWEEILSLAPSKIHFRLRGRTHGEIYSMAQLRSFALFGASDEWFEVNIDSLRELWQYSRKCSAMARIIERYNSKKRELVNSFVKKALATGRVYYFERLLTVWNNSIKAFKTYDEFASKTLDAALRFCPYPWNEELARAFCNVSIKLFSSEESDVSIRAKRLFLPMLCFCPPAVRKEQFDFATCGNDVFLPSEADVKAYSDACAWRDQFDRLFDPQEQGTAYGER